MPSPAGPPPAQPPRDPTSTRSDPGAAGRRGHRGHRAAAPADRRTALNPLPVALLVAGLLMVFGAGGWLVPALLATGPGSAPVAAHSARAPATAPGGPANDAAPTSPDPTTIRPSPSDRPSPTASATPGRTSATARPASGATAQQDHGAATQEDRVVALVNQERAKAGCGAVHTDPRLRTAARAHSSDMATNGYFSHTGLDGSTFVDRAAAAGYPRADAAGENIAYGYATAAAVMTGWMNSDGHRRNILNCSARAIGVGLAYNRTGRAYWTQVFGRT